MPIVLEQSCLGYISDIPWILPSSIKDDLVLIVQSIPQTCFLKSTRIVVALSTPLSLKSE